MLNQYIRGAIKLHNATNIGLESNSKVFSTLSCNSNNVSNTMTAHFAIACGTTNGTKCANENSDKDYLNGISLENEKHERKGPLLNEKLTKIFKI